MRRVLLVSALLVTLSGCGSLSASSSGSLPADEGSLLVRTDFADQAAWDRLVRDLDTPNANGFVPYLSPVDDRRWDGASVADLAAAAPPYELVVVADPTALSAPGEPLTVLQVVDGEVRQMRVAPVGLASVQNNLSLGNMDWEDYAGSVDPDGVFRGFH